MPGFITTTLLITFTDLEPGDEFDCYSVYSWGESGSHKINEGFGTQKVDSAGVVTFPYMLDAMTQGHQGSAKIWIVPKGADEDAQPAKDKHGNVCRFTKHLP